jgi:hypothetical protein
MGTDIAAAENGARISYASSFHEDFPPRSIIEK